MRKPDVRIYGRLHGVDHETFAALDAELEDVERSLNSGVVDLEHEGHYIDVDSVVEVISRLLPASCWGKLDVIDNGEWRLTRYEFEDGRMRFKVMDINNVLDPLNVER